MESVINVPNGGRFQLTYDPETVWARRAKLVALIKGRANVSTQQALSILKGMRDHTMLSVAWECPDIFEVRDLTWQAELEARAAEERRMQNMRDLLKAAQAGDAAAALEFCKTFNPMDWAMFPRA